MRIDLLFPALPPALDGIGDHTARLAEALAPYAEVRILTAQSDALPIPGVRIEHAFTLASRSGIQSVQEAVAAAPPDVLLVEFNQFSYGRWGLNPYLPWTLAAIKRAFPSVHLAWMAHEDFVPPTSWKNRIMRRWQRWQFQRLGALADTIFFSIEPWARQYADWFPDTPVFHLPVGSNMPDFGLSHSAARARLGIPDSTLVAGIFGTLHASRLTSLMRTAAEVLYEEMGEDFLLLYVGPDGETARTLLGSVPLRDAGRLAPEDVSMHLSAMDLQLAPFLDGVSTRRGSVLAALQHGLPVVSTDGPLTDPLLRSAHGDALLLAPLASPAQFVDLACSLGTSASLRKRIGAGARVLYEDALSFDVITRSFLSCLPAPYERPYSHAAG